MTRRGPSPKPTPPDCVFSVTHITLGIQVTISHRNTMEPTHLCLRNLPCAAKDPSAVAGKRYKNHGHGRPGSRFHLHLLSSPSTLIPSPTLCHHHYRKSTTTHLASHNHPHNMIIHNNK